MSTESEDGRSEAADEIGEPMGLLQIRATDRLFDVKDVVFVDPFTWAWVATLLAEGAISWAAGRLLSTLFGQSNDTGRILEAIKQAVRELKVFIREEIEANVLDTCASESDAAWRDLLDYQDAPTFRVNRLNSALEQSRSSMMRLVRVGRAAFGPYINAVSVLLTAQRAEAELIAAPRGWLAIQRTCAEAVETVSGWNEQFIGVRQAAIDSVSAIKWEQVTVYEDYFFTKEPGPGDRRRSRRVTIYYFIYQGGRFDHEQRGLVERKRAQISAMFTEERDRYIREVSVPVTNVMEKWKSIAGEARAKSEDQVSP